ncbi:MAG: hypothetical protein CM1200mP2_41510 [Planctomycetaceae bacterium]|nr:MAG: hypothetical protein CM1200mP2_41510 [Planctomycetaceae bacterium]
MFLHNDPLIRMRLDESGWIDEVAEAATGPKAKATAADRARWIRLAWLRTVGRPPSETEVSRAERHLATSKSIPDGLRDLLWALINTKDFRAQSLIQLAVVVDVSAWFPESVTKRIMNFHTESTFSRRSLLQARCPGRRADTGRWPETAGRRKGPKGGSLGVGGFLGLPGGGAPSHQDTFDLKPQAAAEFRGEFRPIDTSVAGVQICEHMPNLARDFGRYAIVRGVTHNLADHGMGKKNTC